MPKIAIVAGEPSGDLIAGRLMLELNKRYKNIHYIGVGGPNMAKYGLNSAFDYSLLSVRGYFEVIKNILTLLKLRKNLIDYFLNQKPDIFIGVDAPDFNFAIERCLKANKIKTFHYIAPSVWAWRKKRINNMKQDMHHLFSIFPHEKTIFKKIKLPFTYVGHPLASNIPINPSIKKAREKLDIRSHQTVLSLLPGSRKGEVKWHLDLLLNAALIINKNIQDCDFLIPVNNKLNYDYVLKKLKNYDIQNIRVIIGHSHDVICSSNIVLLASGTASLEAALFKKPMVIIYKMSWISWLFLKRMHLIPYIGLPNILLDKFLVPELLQNKATSENIAVKAIEILANKKYLAILKIEFKALHQSLKKDTSLLIINQIQRYLK